MGTPHELALTRLTAEDWELWRSLRLRALKEAPYAFGSRLADWQGAGDLEQRWRERLASVPFNLIATLHNSPVGMVSATEPDKDGTVDLISLWVAPSGRGIGIGDALVEAVVQWAVVCEASGVSLDVTEDNHHAMNLYIRNGFFDLGTLVSMSSGESSERRFVKSLLFSSS